MDGDDTARWYGVSVGDWRVQLIYNCRQLLLDPVAESGQVLLSTAPPVHLRVRWDRIVRRPVAGYTVVVIVGFKHRGLKRFFEAGDTRGLNPNHVSKIRRILARLQAAASLRDLNAPGLRLHPLKGGRKGQWTVDVDRNWRITFRFDGRDCDEINYEDYH